MKLRLIFSSLLLGICSIAFGQGIITVPSTSGTNTYTATISPVPAYTVGLKAFVTFSNANTTTSVSLNLNSKGAINVQKNGGTVIGVGEFHAGQPILLQYNGTNWQVVNSIESSIGVTGTLTSTRVPFASGTHTLADQSTFNFASNILTIPGELKTASTMILTSSGVYQLAGNSTQAAELRLLEDTDDGTNYTAFKVGTQAGNVTYTLPTAAPGVTGYVLSGTTGGVLSWISPTGISFPLSDSELIIDNPAATFSYTIKAQAIVADRNLYLPLTTATDTLVTKSEIDALTLDTPIDPAYGGTGNANNTASKWIISGNFATTITVGATTAITFPASGTMATLAGTETFTNKTLTTPKIGTITDTNGNEQFIMTPTASAVNEITFNNAATGTNPRFTASGGDTNIGIDFLTKATGVFRFTGNSTQAAEVRLLEDTDDGTNYTAFKVGTQSGNITYTLPTAAPAVNGYVLSGTTAGVLSWVVQSGGGGGGVINTAAVNEIPKSDGIDIGPSGIFSTTLGNANFGTGLPGATRIIAADGSATDVTLTLLTKGAGNLNLTTITGSVIATPGVNGGGFIGNGGESTTNGVAAGGAQLLGGQASVGNTNGGSGSVSGGDSAGSGIGGSGILQGGGAAGTGGSGGDVQVLGGVATGAATGAGRAFVQGGAASVSGLAGGYVLVRGGGASAGNADGGNVYITGGAKSGSGNVGNIALFVSSGGTFGGGAGVMFWADATTNSSTNPTAGGIFEVHSADHLPYWRSPAGTVYPLTSTADGTTITGDGSAGNPFTATATTGGLININNLSDVSNTGTSRQNLGAMASEFDIVIDATSSKTLAASDFPSSNTGKVKYLITTNSSPHTFAIPNDATMTMAVGAMISGENDTGAGAMTFSATAPATVTGTSGGLLAPSAGFPWTLIKKAANTWLLKNSGTPIGSAHQFLKVDATGTSQEYGTASNGLTPGSGSLKWGGALTADTGLPGLFSVALGLSTPLAKLHIQGNGTTTGGLLLLTDNTAVTPVARLTLLDNGKLTWTSDQTGASIQGLDFTASLTSSANSQTLNGFKFAVTRTYGANTGVTNNIFRILDNAAANDYLAIVQSSSGTSTSMIFNSCAIYDFKNSSSAALIRNSAAALRIAGGTSSTATMLEATVTTTSSTNNNVFFSFNGTTHATASALTRGWGEIEISPTINAVTGSTITDIVLNIIPTFALNTSTGTITGLNWNPTLTSGTFNNYAMRLQSGLSALGHTNVPTAFADLAATTTASASLRMRSGTAPTSPNDGDLWYDGTNYFARSTSTYTIAKTLTNTATLDFGSTAAGTATDLTITVTGAASGDVVSVGVPNGSTVANGSFTGWVSASNTVTVRFTNNNLVTALDPASGTFRASVLKY